MAINKERLGEILQGIDLMFDVVMENVPEAMREQAESFLREKLLEPMLEEVRKVFTDSRPPTFFMLGRSGHGKSSLINALAGQDVAEESPIKPQTNSAEEYEIRFPNSDNVWKIIDSRGIFESTKANGARVDNPVEALTADIIRNEPDIILHVINAPESGRTLEPDIKILQPVQKKVREKTGIDFPHIAVLNKCDTIGDRPRDWPPEKFPAKAALIDETVYNFRKNILPFLDGERQIYVDVVPTSCAEPDPWNIDALSELIFGILPQEAVLQFVKDQKSARALRKLASSIINKFANIAAGISATNPLPIADIVLLIPLQLTLILFIGILAGKEPSKETLKDYLLAVGFQVGAGVGFREIARAGIKLIPVGGWFVSAVIARQGTFAIGKSAEAYFFKGKKIKPGEMYNQAAVAKE